MAKNIRLGVAAFGKSATYTPKEVRAEINRLKPKGLSCLQLLSTMTPAEAQEIGRICAGEDVEPGLLYCTMGNIGPEGDQQAARDALSTALSNAKALCAGYGKQVTLCSPAFFGGLNNPAIITLSHTVVRQRQVAFLASMASAIQDSFANGVTCCAEALGRWELKRGPNASGAALSIIQDAGLRSVMNLLWDTTHVGFSGADPLSDLRVCFNDVGLIHISEHTRGALQSIGSLVSSGFAAGVRSLFEQRQCPIVFEGFCQESPANFFEPLGVYPEILPKSSADRLFSDALELMKASFGLS